MGTVIGSFATIMLTTVAAIAIAKLLLLWQPLEAGKKLGAFI